MLRRMVLSDWPSTPCFDLFGIVFFVNFMDFLFYSIVLVFNLLCQCPPFDLGMADVLVK
jgi:hypothetical protein